MYDSALPVLLRCSHFLCWRECLYPHCHLRCSSAHCIALGPYSAGASDSDDTYSSGRCSQRDDPSGRSSFSCRRRRCLTHRGVARVSLSLWLRWLRLLRTIVHRQLSSATNQLRVIRDRDAPSLCL